MTKEISRILRMDDNFLVVTHINPDGDAVGSLLGLALALSEMGKKSWAFAGKELLPAYHFLPGSRSLVTDARDIRPRPRWIVAVDTAEENRIFGDISPFRDGAKLINIDHHFTNPKYGHLNFVDPGATSSAELVFRLIKDAGYVLSRDVAKCLYTGLITDTGCFRFPGVNSRTLLVAAEILAAGFDSYEVTRPLYEENPFTRIQLERLVLERIEMRVHGRLCVSTLYADDFVRIGADQSETENLVDRLREIQGVEAGVLVTEISKDLTRVSFRSKKLLDVAAVARIFGGGGHHNAAGLRTPVPPAEIKEKIAAAIEQALSSPSTPTP